MSDHTSSPNARPSMATDPEAYMRQFEAKTAAMRANAARLQEALSAANATVASEEGEVQITVGMGGTLQAIEFGPAHRHMSGQGLAELIMEIYREAAAEASTVSVDLMSGILGDDSEAISVMRRYAQGGGDR